MKINRAPKPVSRTKVDITRPPKRTKAYKSSERFHVTVTHKQGAYSDEYTCRTFEETATLITDMWDIFGKQRIHMTVARTLHGKTMGSVNAELFLKVQKASTK